MITFIIVYLFLTLLTGILIYRTWEPVDQIDQFFYSSIAVIIGIWWPLTAPFFLMSLAIRKLADVITHYARR